MRYVERLRGQRMNVAPKRARVSASPAALLQLEWRNSKLKSEISKLKTQNSACLAALLQLEWHCNSTEISELKTQNPKLRTQNWNVERYCNECGVTVSTGFNLIWRKFNFKLRLSGWMSTGFNLICTLIMMFENKNFTQMLSEIFVKR